MNKEKKDRKRLMKLIEEAGGIFKEYDVPALIIFKHDTGFMSMFSQIDEDEAIAGGHLEVIAAAVCTLLKAWNVPKEKLTEFKEDFFKLVNEMYK